MSYMLYNFTNSTNYVCYNTDKRLIIEWECGIKVIAFVYVICKKDYKTNFSN